MRTFLLGASVCGITSAMVSLVGCFDVSIAPGSLRCSANAPRPCPRGMVCLGADQTGQIGRCFPEGSTLPGDGSPGTDVYSRPEGPLREAYPNPERLDLGVQQQTAAGNKK